MEKMNNYSGTICGNSGCNGRWFEVVKDTPKDSEQEICYLRCFHCKRIVSCIPNYDITKQLNDILNDLENIKSKLGINSF